MDDGGQVSVSLECEPPGPRHPATCLISIVRHDEKVRECDIPADHPFGILEERCINTVADGLGGALIGLDERAAMHLIVRQHVDPLLQLLDDIAD